MRKLSLAVLLSVTLAPLSAARATIDTLLPYHFVYTELQTGDACLGRQLMWAEIGIPPASQAEATAAPVLVYRQATGDHVDINALSGAGIEPVYVSDSFDARGVLTYAMKLDLRGSTRGRAETVELAKLYLIAMAANLDEIAAAGWRLEIEFLGLPSQTGLRGTRLYSTTRWPYTRSSSLLASYQSELIDANGACRAR